MEFLKSVAGKLVTGLVVLAVFAVGFAWYRMTPDERSPLASGAGKGIGWVLGVAVVPWVLIFAINRVRLLDNNTASGVFILGLTGLEAAALAWMFGFAIHGSPAWTFFVVGVLLAGVYNLLTCDWIAERFE